jgi:2-methylcitrate dehydratase
VQVIFQGGARTEKVAVAYPLGHRRRRAEGLPALRRKFQAALAGALPPARAARIEALCDDAARLGATPATDFMDLWAV